MKLTVTGRHLTVTEANRRAIARKLVRLDRLLNDGAISAQCILGHEAKTAICELTLHVRGDHMLHGEGRHARMATAVTLAVDRVSQQAHRLKDRWKSRRRQAVKMVEPTPAAHTPAVSRAAKVRKPRIFRSKAHVARPMSVEEAVVALGAEERPFLVFRDVKSDTVAVLYARPDGQFGLIDTGA